LTSGSLQVERRTPIAPSFVVRRSIGGLAAWRMKAQASSGRREPEARVSIQKTLSDTLRPPDEGSGATSTLPLTGPSTLSPSAAKPNQLVISAILPSQNIRPDLTLSSSRGFGAMASASAASPRMKSKAAIASLLTRSGRPSSLNGSPPRVQT
jgi:hypothetical protein